VALDQKLLTFVQFSIAMIISSYHENQRQRHL